MELTKGQTYITTWGAILTVKSVDHELVTYSSKYVYSQHPELDSALSTNAFEEMIRSRILLLDTPANRILYCRF